MNNSLLLVSSDYFPSLGGIQSWVKVLSDSGLDTLALSEGSIERRKNLSLKKRSPSTLVRILKLFLSLLTMPQKNFIAFQVGSAGLACYLVCLLKPWRTYYVVIHGNEILRPRGKLSFYLFQHILKNAKSVLCNSDYTKHLVYSYYPKVVRSHVWHPAVKVDYTNNSSSKIILTVASFLERKNQIKVIEALSFLPEFEYWIVGSGSESELQNLKSHAQGKNVKFFINQVDLEPFFSKASHFVLLSSSDLEKNDVEGFGIAPVEALWAGIPSLVFDQGGLPETGCVTISAHSTSSEIAHAIQHLTLTSPNPKTHPQKAIEELHQILESTL